MFSIPCKDFDADLIKPLLVGDSESGARAVLLECNKELKAASELLLQNIKTSTLYKAEKLADFLSFSNRVNEKLHPGK